MENKSFSDKDRINFQYLRENGRRIQTCPWLVVYWSNNNIGKLRLLWNLSRKVGKSVVRNRIKRCCREFIRNRLKDLISKKGLDLNLSFRPSQKDFYKDLRREDIEKQLYQIEKKIRINFEKSI